MGASVVGILAVLVAAAGLVAWLLVSLLGGVVTMALGFVLVCLLMMLIILIQKPRGGGLSGAFGGAGGSTQAAFGAKTGDVLTFATIVFFVFYMALAMGLTWATGPESDTAEAPQPISAPAAPEQGTGDTEGETPVDTEPAENES